MWYLADQTIVAKPLEAVQFKPRRRVDKIGG
jgi:hypothetical protein